MGEGRDMPGDSRKYFCKEERVTRRGKGTPARNLATSSADRTAQGSARRTSLRRNKADLAAEEKARGERNSAE